MCGIFGILRFSRQENSNDLNAINIALTAMKHRGPDAQNTQVVVPGMTLGAVRLAITDPRPCSNLPMWTADRQICLVFNGQIYNYQQLRCELSETYNFSTNSDTEVLAALLEKWGIAGLNRLEGMYAFAAYDLRQEELILAVDPSGQKPLFYEVGSDYIAFSSEIGALLAALPAKRSFNKLAIAESIAHRFIVGEDTHITEIKRLRGGFTLCSSSQVGSPKSFYQVPLNTQKRTNLDEIQLEYRDSVHQSCKLAFETTEIAGLLLSGGIDSSAVLAEAARQGVSLKTFSVGFEHMQGKSFYPAIFDEFKFSRSVSAQYQSDHHEVLLTAKDYFEGLQEWANICDEPLGTDDSIALLILFKLIKPECSVVFNGSGPDEQLDGYLQGWRLAQDQSVSVKNLEQKYYQSFMWLDEVDINQLFIANNPEQAVVAKYSHLLSPYKESCQDITQLVQLLNFHGRFSAYEFRQMDLASMSQSIEARSPLGSRLFTRVAFSHDPKLKNINGDEKWIFKQALNGLLNSEVALRKKAGFPIPSELWFTDEFYELANPVFSTSSQLAQLGILNFDYVLQMWNSGKEGFRNLFLRLFMLNAVLERHSRYIK
jgi:asparagine synthase (glutamine-hydrolysing)